jgi:urease accessory protein
VALISGGALLLGGDRVDIEIEVGDGCKLDLTDIGGTVAYDGEGRSAEWNVTIRLGHDASLAWPGLPFVVSTGASVHRRTVATLGERSWLLLRETFVLGRDRETGGRLVARGVVTGPEGPILVEHFELDGRRPVPGVAAGYRVLDSALLAGRRAPQAAVDNAEEALVISLEALGTLARWLGHETHLSPIDKAWARMLQAH